MWMLDVFCCALGCVILLLLLKMREANFTAEESSNVRNDLLDAQNSLFESDMKNLILGADISETQGKLALVQQERDELAKHLALVQKERDKTAKELALVRGERDKSAKNLALVEELLEAKVADLALSRKKLDENAKFLALAKERDAANDEELAKKKFEMAELAKKAAALQKEQDAVKMLVLEKEKARAAAIRQTLDFSDRLIAAETKLKSSERLVDDLMAKGNDAVKLRTRVSDLEKQIADANVTIVDLQGTRAKLADKVNQLQVEAEQRFAGIAMTGRNVVFMVDMSGSMDRTDENTVDATKWPTVRETLIKVMRSLPDLQQYQVILFSSKFNYLMGGAGQWFRYEKDKSIEQVRKALAATKPVGDTNLYAAFEETFRLRSKGLDTIYLFSDGLPTSGPGLTAAEEKNLSENERGVILARVLRRAIKSSWNAPDTKRQRVRINSVGFFYESPDVGAFLWALSRDNDGSFVGMSRP
jgi:hypothetical protein